MKTPLKLLVVFATLMVSLAVVTISGMAILGQYSINVRTPTTGEVTGITVATNGSVSTFGSSYPYVQTVTGCYNASDVSNTLTAANYTVYEGNAVGGGIILADTGTSFIGETINCSSVSYKASNDGVTAANNFQTGLSIFGTFIALLVLVAMGVIIYGMVREQMNKS